MLFELAIIKMLKKSAVTNEKARCVYIAPTKVQQLCIVTMTICAHKLFSPFAQRSPIPGRISSPLLEPNVRAVLIHFVVSVLNTSQVLNLPGILSTPAAVHGVMRRTLQLCGVFSGYIDSHGTDIISVSRR